MKDIAIRCEGLGKQYQIGERERYRALRDTIANKITTPFRWLCNPQSTIRNPPSGAFWALKDLSFEIKPGEVVGIIGRNGAGKSTLLKILARITAPTVGEVEVRGRVGSLLEVGTGFHPELTGRENIFLNGAILGMKKVEIARNFDEIVAFAEIERFIDTPVKRYSSGMYVRLAFAVAAHMEPEILLVDEVLAVGDAGFQKKCLGKMGDVAKEGRTILFVSHNMNAVANLCNKALWIDGGVLRLKDTPQSVVLSYLSMDSELNGKLRFSGEGSHHGEDVSITGASVEPQYRALNNGMQIEVKYIVRFNKDCDCNFILYVYREGELAFLSTDFHSPLLMKPLPASKELEVIFHIPKYLLNPGHHSFGFAVVNKGGNFRQLASIHDILPIRVDDDQFRRGGEYLLGWNGSVSPILQITAQEVRND